MLRACARSWLRADVGNVTRACAAGGYAGDYGRNAGVLYAQPGYAPDYGFHTAPRPAPDAESINGKAVYIFGSGADRMRKTEGKLVLCSQSGEIKIEVSGHGPLSAAEFARLAKNQWKRPRQNIKLAQSDQTLEDFEYVMNAVPPGTCRRYPLERDTEEQQRAEQADTVRMRQLKRQHERNLRRSMKRKVAVSLASIVGRESPRHRMLTRFALAPCRPTLAMSVLWERPSYRNCVRELGPTRRRPRLPRWTTQSFKRKRTRHTRRGRRILPCCTIS